MLITVRQALAQSGLVPIDAQVLLAHALHRDRAWLAAHGNDALTPEQAQAFFAVAKRRREGEPVAYLTGSREFWGLALAVTRDVLIPRPETETLVELALAWLPRDRPVRVLDLGTGSGAIALAIASESAAGTDRCDRHVSRGARSSPRQCAAACAFQRRVRAGELV